METPLTRNIDSARGPLGIAEYERTGGYEALRAALRMAPRDIQKMVTDSGLRGRGGAGFPTGQKWSAAPAESEARHPKYLLVNADEMEPGTFKDRYLLEGDPHSFVESAIISSYATEADVAYVFIRWAYNLAARRVQQAIDEAYLNGYLGKRILGSGYSLDMHVHMSAGRYMCGEENGLINALEGKRPLPRIKPPYPRTCGLWGKPTVVNNVETIANVMHIVAKGPAWFRSLSVTGEGGTKLYGVSGRVRRPGLWELPLGVSLREVIEEHAGGMADGYAFRAAQPGGASTEFVLEKDLDAKMDFGGMEKVGSRVGTGTVIVLDDKACPVGLVENMEHFFSRESCGWCTPCREGLHWVHEILAAIEAGRGRPGDIEILEQETRLLGPHHTFCALAPGAMEPLQSALKCFREDFEAHISGHRCPRRS
jgi:NADH-quinone oxidoreductase subunit F